MPNRIKADSASGLQLISDSSDEIQIQSGTDTVATINSSGITMGSGKVMTQPGGIIQVQHTVDKNQTSNTVSTTFEELSTNQRVTITPTSTDNYVMLEAWIPYSGAGTTRVWQFYFYDVTGSAGVDLGTANGSRNQALAGWRGEHHDANDAGMLHLKQLVQAPRTTATTYTIYARCENSQTIYFNYSSGNSSVYGWTGSSLITATEISA